MTMITKCALPVGFFLNSLCFAPCSSAQEKQIFEVYKLENKIGTEEVTAGSGADSSNIHIAIRTLDRGYNLSLVSDVASTSQGFKIKLNGYTSRFKKESLDTLCAVSAGFPLTENGSIKMREMLIEAWIKKGKPNFIKSALDSSKFYIQEILVPAAAHAELKEFRAYLIHDNLNEVLWLDSRGKSIFLTTTDTEGDKREIIDAHHVPLFARLNQQSTQFLLQAYGKEASKLGQVYASIAIMGGNIIDLESKAEIQKNTMILIADGKISYVGSIDKQLIPAGAKVIDASNKFLIPALWDMHAHIFHPSYLQKEILSGVTSVRDMANELDLVVQLKALASAGQVPAPNIYAAGLLDGKATGALGAMLATNPEEIKVNVKRYHDAGFNQIKIYDNVRKKDFSTIVTEAKRYHMDVVGHLPTGYTMSYFINNGMNSISHLHYFMNNIKWSATDLLKENIPLLESLKSNHVYLDPTLNVYRLTGDKRIPALKRLLKLFSDYGIPIVAGTDNEGTIPEEIETYVQLGMSPLDALRTATTVPAAIMGVTANRGSIEKGKNSELLILEENPLLNIKTLRDKKIVIKGGFVITTGQQ